jgi:hypothetical protein
LSLNFGTDAIAALAGLRDNNNFREFHDKLGELVNQMSNAALEPSGEASRDDKCGYARALRDVWIAVEAAVTGAKYNSVGKPGPVQTKARAYSP